MFDALRENRSLLFINLLDEYTPKGYYLNMRKGPSTDYEICGVIFKM